MQRSKALLNKPQTQMIRGPSQSAGSLVGFARADGPHSRLQMSEAAMKEPEEKDKREEAVDSGAWPARSARRRRLVRSYTDPTDMLWVFRSRGLTKPSDECPNQEFYGYEIASETKEGEVQRPGDAAGETPSTKKLSDEATSQAVRHSYVLTRLLGLDDARDMDPRHHVHLSNDRSTRETFLSAASDEHPRRRKISAPASRPRRSSLVGATAGTAARRNSVVALPPRRARRGSEAPSLTSLARKRASQAPSYPVGLKRRTSKGFLNTDLQFNIQAKAKHEMLAQLVLPAFVEHAPRTRERRNTITVSGRTKKDEKRYQIAKEILETEKKYLACLKILNTVFEQPMREGNYIPQKYIDLVFPGELIQIRESHTLFMKDLEERLGSSQNQFDIVGDIFTKLSSSYHINVLKIYSDYVNNFPKAIAAINKCSRGSHKFRKFLESCSTKPECDGLDISAFLLTPIQRLPRYVLLLRQLSKYTDAGHPDSFHIENALEIMKQMINVLNDSIQGSCKLANNGSRKGLKAKKSFIKKKEIQKLSNNSQDNEHSATRSTESSPSSATPVKSNESAEISSTSFTSTSSPRSASPKTTVDAKRNSPPADSSASLTTNRDKALRAVSAGDPDRFGERGNQSDFDVIEEEDDETDGKDKSPGTSKIKTAAGTLIRNLQRRSKKWRRSVDENVLAAEQRKLSHEGRSAESSEVDGELHYTDGASDNNTKDSRESILEDSEKSSASHRRPRRARPMSLVLPAGNATLENNLNELKTRVLSDNTLSRDRHSGSNIWVPRQPPAPRRKCSDSVASSSRHSSVASSEASQLFDSRKSLLRISQESLTDSGVSETPNGSPSNTLGRSNTLPWRKNRSLSGDERCDRPERPHRPNRRSWFGYEFDRPVGLEAETNNNHPKNKRKLKKVMKDFFLGKRRSQRSSGQETRSVDEKMSSV